tara:strand:- start:97 stop:468 length:372 start_codon:yes stop_codon:yes gene_type:complete
VSDARIPSHYFLEKDQQVQAALDRVRDRLDDLKNRLDQLKAQRATTKAHQQIKDKEIESVEKQQYRRRNKRFAMDAVDQIATGDRADAVEAIKEALDHKAFVRSAPHLINVGSQIQNQVFRGK